MTLVDRASPPVHAPGVAARRETVSSRAASVAERLVAFSWLLPLAIIGAIGARRWGQLGSPVSGLDGGQWLALGRGLLGGEGRSTDGAYPPLVPLLVTAMRTLVGPMVAARAVGIGSLALVMIAVYLAARGGSNPWFATMAAATVGMASVVAEPVAYGGYPQNYALAALVAGTYALGRFFTAGGRWRLAGAAAAMAAAALAHHMYFPVTAVVAIGVWLVWLTTRPAAGMARRRTLGAVVAGGIAIACYLPTAIAFRLAGYDPPVNANHQGFWAALRYGVREAPTIWTVVLVAGVIGLLLTWRERHATWSVTASMIAATALLFPVTSEVRLLPPLILGGTLGLTLGLQAIWGWLRERGTWPGRLAWGAVVAATLAPALLWPRADAQANDFVRYYRVVDPGLLAVARFVDRYPETGLVAVRESPRGWPVGWWFEGLTDARVAVGSNEKWLGFPSERDQARVASALFGGRRTGAAEVKVAHDEGVELLVFRKWEWIGWKRWQAEPSPATEVLYDDGEWMVVRVGLSAAATGS